MKPHVLDLCGLANSAPSLADVNEVFTFFLAREDVRVARQFGRGLQDRDGGLAQGYDLSLARFGVW